MYKHRLNYSYLYETKRRKWPIVIVLVTCSRQSFFLTLFVQINSYRQDKSNIYIYVIKNINHRCIRWSFNLLSRVHKLIPLIQHLPFIFLSLYLNLSEKEQH